MDTVSPSISLQIFAFFAPAAMVSLLQESYTSTTEEEDPVSGTKTVKFEKSTVRKTVRYISTSTSTHSLKNVASSSRTPSEEKIDDSDYLTQSNGNWASTSKTSSQSSLSGRFTSEESLGRPLSREECDHSSRSGNSGSEWAQEFSKRFYTGTSKLEYVRSKSQYEEHIHHIRGRQLHKLVLKLNGNYL